MRFFALSETMTVCEQNASVTDETPKIEEISHPATNPFTNLSGSSISGSAEVKDDTYTERKKVANKTTRISGVMSDMKKVCLSLKYNLMCLAVRQRRSVRSLRIFRSSR